MLPFPSVDPVDVHGAALGAGGIQANGTLLLPSCSQGILLFYHLAFGALDPHGCISGLVPQGGFGAAQPLQVLGHSHIHPLSPVRFCFHDAIFDSCCACAAFRGALDTILSVPFACGQCDTPECCPPDPLSVTSQGCSSVSDSKVIGSGDEDRETKGQKEGLHSLREGSTVTDSSKM